MRLQITSRIQPIIDAIGEVIRKRLTVEEPTPLAFPGEALSISIEGVELLVRSDGELQENERHLIRRAVELSCRETLLRSEGQILEQRLRSLERENGELLLKNRALGEFSLRDPLTGLYARWFVVDQVEAELSRAVRHGTPMSLLMIDLDHFKRVNDRHGHAAGDQVLHAVGQLLRDSCRTYDVPGRYGGEEFCLLLPHTRLEHTHSIAERIRRRLEGTVVASADSNLQVTASIGIVSLDSTPDEAVFGAAALLERADRALSSAKDRGRNRIEQWSASMHQGALAAFDH
jgi:diguanylate cyclase (GGDEF)-like protein